MKCAVSFSSSSQVLPTNGSPRVPCRSRSVSGRQSVGDRIWHGQPGNGSGGHASARHSICVTKSGKASSHSGSNGVMRRSRDCSANARSWKSSSRSTSRAWRGWERDSGVWRERGRGWKCSRGWWENGGMNANTTYLLRASSWKLTKGQGMKQKYVRVHGSLLVALYLQLLGWSPGVSVWVCVRVVTMPNCDFVSMCSIEIRNTKRILGPKTVDFN